MTDGRISVEKLAELDSNKQPNPETLAAIEGELAGFDRKLWHIRHSIVCGLVDIARLHGKKPYSNLISQAITEIQDIVERIVAPDDDPDIAVDGFGEPARAQTNAAIQETIDKLLAIGRAAQKQTPPAQDAGGVGSAVGSARSIGGDGLERAGDGALPYYNPENNNFYHPVTREGMGVGFYERNRQIAAHYPQGADGGPATH